MPKYKRPDVVFELQRDSRFSYRCNACSRCCHNKAIPVGPYEILRLARRLGMTTTEFIKHNTEAGGTVLRTRAEDRACIFLGAQGCSVHPDRPLVCRLYPLALQIGPDGTEAFGMVSAHPDTEGVYGNDGTVGDFLDQQGVSPYLKVAEKYKRLHDQMIEHLENLDAEEFQKLAQRENEITTTAAGVAASPWIDIDRTVAEFCRGNGRPIPEDIDATIATHIEAIETWLASLGSSSTDASSTLAEVPSIAASGHESAAQARSGESRQKVSRRRG
jgi:Fe-S-cluster containining protein